MKIKESCSLSNGLPLAAQVMTFIVEINNPFARHKFIVKF